MTSFQVRLSFNMDSHTPSDAVEDVIDTFTEKGFRDFVYVVADADGKHLGYFNGWGEPLDVSEVEARASAPSTLEPTPDIDDERDHAETKTDGDDAELEQLAASLNEE